MFIISGGGDFVYSALDPYRDWERLFYFSITPTVINSIHILKNPVNFSLNLSLWLHKCCCLCFYLSSIFIFQRTIFLYAALKREILRCFFVVDSGHLFNLSDYKYMFLLTKELIFHFWSRIFCDQNSRS